MKNLLCPQCEIHRYHIRNQPGDCLVVTVNEKYEINPIYPDDSLEGFDLTILYCLGCSWKGSPKSLRKGRHQ